MSDKRDPFTTLVRDIYKLFAIWSQIDDETLIRFAKQVYSITLTPNDIQQFRKACGLENDRFKHLARTVVEWRLATELRTFGYSSKTKDKLVLSCVEACEEIVGGKFSTLLISEWVEDVYEELACFSNQPLRIAVYATEKSAQLRELLGCETLPKISLRG